ncbi:dihydrofolate reductase [Dactylosporangium roseum]|uniref:Dihydrofolate reductase n=1 Tax=Dactylosporangium roseum TaxID=47989 RepID=A0ABY5Z3I3_9ACTN|nr:dihydrofolate reductase family protein [Dactylosporangium roseum]UWZ36594.1 dihydrofolate reductase [Dactylosporangium roseum]
MRRIFLHINVSLDGYICDTAGDIDWHFSDEEFQRYLDQLLESIDGMIFGRVAFEQLAAYWPTAGDEVSAVQARKMHELPKYVLSRTLKRAGWHNTHLLGDDPATALARLKQRDGGDLALFAGARAATTAVGLGVLDELRLIVNPVLLGGGARLFDGTYPKAELCLAHTHQFASGAMLLAYETAAQ